MNIVDKDGISNNGISNNEEKNNEQTNKPSQSAKDELISTIKEWIKMDNDITKLKSEIKEKTHKKTELTTSLINIMKNNSIDCFDINGGALVYKQKKSRKTISGKFLLTQLEEYYKDSPHQDDFSENDTLVEELREKGWIE